MYRQVGSDVKSSAVVFKLYAYQYLWFEVLKLLYYRSLTIVAFISSLTYLVNIVHA